MVEAVFFDYGGVLAEEGFVEGLSALAVANSLDPQRFLTVAFDCVYTSGYLTGQADEAAFWRSLRRETGIGGTDAELRREILSRFILRPWMCRLADDLRSKNIVTAILSDQTNWLDELEERDRFFRFFDAVFNSFHTGLSKRDEALFDAIPRSLDREGSRLCLIDDNRGNCDRARRKGWRVIRYHSGSQILRELAALLPAIEISHPAPELRDDGSL